MRYDELVALKLFDSNGIDLGSLTIIFLCLSTCIEPQSTCNSPASHCFIIQSYIVQLS